MLEKIKELLESMDYENRKKAAVIANSFIDPFKPYGSDLHNQYIRLNPSVSIETVAILRNVENGQLEVFLVWRGEDAPAYKNAWNCPGTFMKPGELEEVGLDRLSVLEYGCPIRSLGKVGWDNNPNEERGHCIHHVFLVELLGKGKKGKWFPVDSLPPELVEHHRQVVIPMAVNAFEKISSR